MASADPPVADPSPHELSLVRGDLLFRVQRRLGLIPPQGLGVGRRVIVFIAITWLPIAIWSLNARRLWSDSADEPVLHHFGVPVRLLVAIPLLIAAEAVAAGVMARVLPQFVRSGSVPAEQRPRFEAALRDVARLRDAWLPWLAIAGVVLAWSLADTAFTEAHELRWAADAGASEPGLGFGGWWYVLVARPLYYAFAAAWLWRLLLEGILLRRIAKLDLSLVPTHPDRAGGLGFVGELAFAWSAVVLAISAVLASRWAHEVAYHGVHVTTLRAPMIAFLVLVTLLFLAPLLAFSGPLRRARRAALHDYGSLVAEHGRRVRRRWILGLPVADDALLTAPELGPVADTAALYESVQRMRTLPIGREALLAIAVPAALPILVVVALEVPVKDLVLKLLSALA